MRSTDSQAWKWKKKLYKIFSKHLSPKVFYFMWSFFPKIFFVVFVKFILFCDFFIRLEIFGNVFGVFEIDSLLGIDRCFDYIKCVSGVCFDPYMPTRFFTNCE